MPRPELDRVLDGDLAPRLTTALAGVILLSVFSFQSPAASLQDTSPLKKRAIGLVDQRRDDWIGISDSIWRFAETALQETNSARFLSDFASREGFQVEKGIGGLPTAFTATYGKGRPVIGIIAEYDALPGLSQVAQPVKKAVVDGGAGHACGHNLFGAASLAAATSVKELMQAGHLQGTLRLYGTPAEERFGGKVYMARAGAFDDLDVCLAWHPSDANRATASGNHAVVDFTVEFHGQAAHAAFDPWNGRSALDALER